MRKSLNGEWILNSDLEGVKDLKVNVPGSIYSDLIKNKIIEEPYYRANEANMLKYMEYEYAYSRDFNLSKIDLEKEINLYFLGLDTVTEIYLNDSLVAKTFNMHRRYRFNINRYAKEGKNILCIKIKSCLEFIKKEFKKQTHELMNMSYAVKGYAAIRKAHCMFGWDWGPQMPDGGIWRDLFLEIVDSGRIDNVRVIQDTSKDLSKVKIEVQNHLISDSLTLNVELRRDDFYLSKIVKAKELNCIELDIHNPSLWYPVGYGEQTLYELKVSLESSEVVDNYTELIGLRKMEIIQEDDEYGRSFTVSVNGVHVFLKGSDYIIEDNVLAHTSIETSRFYLTSAVNCNQNCIRIWGGGLYPSDEFYALCDELGLLVWQDLMFACGYYNMENEDFVREIKEEIIDNVKRIHNHPSIILICGNNENETAALNWNIPSLEYTKKWYLYQYEELIPALLKEVAPDIFYWPSSPSSGGGFVDPNSDRMGDMHYWGVWHNDEPIQNYRLYFPRILSEFGMQSFPSMKTIASFTLPSDRNIYSYVMERHQKNAGANKKIINYIGQMFRYPKDLESISYVSQIIQAEAVRYCVEHLRRNYPRCMGAIYWQLNDCWPVASWSSIDYYRRYKALQYYSKRTFEKVIVSIEENNTQETSYTQNFGKQYASVCVTNEETSKFCGRYKIELLDFDGNVLKTQEGEVEVDGQSAKRITSLEFDLDIPNQFSTVLRVKVFGNDGRLLTNSCSFVWDKYLELKKPNIKYSLKNINDEYKLTIKTDTFAKYVFIDLVCDDVIFSDNYFNLFNDEEKVITFRSDKKIKKKDIRIISLTDSY